MGIFECPPNISVDLHLYFIFYYLGLLNYFFITVKLQSFSLLSFLSNLHISPVNAFLPWQSITNKYNLQPFIPNKWENGLRITTLLHNKKNNIQKICQK